MKNNSFPFAFFEGKFVKTEDAKVSIMTNALQYGTGFFSGIRGYNNEKKKCISVFRLNDHYIRFTASQKILGVEIPYTKNELMKITLDLVIKNRPQTDIYLRPFAYASSYGLTPSLAADKKFAFALYMIPLGDYLPTDKGLSVCISSWRRISDNSIPSRVKPSGGYINSALARKEANDRGFDEAVMLTENGHLSEGSAENLFIVRDGVLITPSNSDEILEGITRRSILQIAKDMGIQTEIRTIDRTELYVADEAFFSGTGVQVSWISKVDGREIGTGKRGPISSKLQEKFFSIVKGDDDNYEQWCTKISYAKPQTYILETKNLTATQSAA